MVLTRSVLRSDGGFIVGRVDVERVAVCGGATGADAAALVFVLLVVELADDVAVVAAFRFLDLALASSSIRRTVSEMAAKSSSGLGSRAWTAGVSNDNGVYPVKVYGEKRRAG